MAPALLRRNINRSRSRDGLPVRQAELDAGVKMILTVKAFLTEVPVTLKSKLRNAASRLPWSRRKGLNATLYCSFCGKSQHKVARLIAGPGVFICDECVGLCNDILDPPAGEPKLPVPLEDLASMPTDRLLHRLKIHGVVFEDARHALQETVDTLRSRDVSWAAIGEALGVSRQAAWDRFS